MTSMIFDLSKIYSHEYLSVRVVVLFLCIVSTFAVLRPRGVPLSKKIFYNPSQNFYCLDGSGSFPFHYVNDDFCDCEDGSDEPGTPACANGFFFCSNYGHLPITLPSSRVNDGICDCCDASDEHNSTAGCLNTCMEVGRLAKEEAQKVYNKYAKGNETRQVYVTEGLKKRQEYQNKMKQLREKEREALKFKLEKQDLKERAVDREQMYLGMEKQLKQEQERKRAMELKILEEQKLQEESDAKKAFTELDINKDGKVTIGELKKFPRFDYDGDGKVSEKEAKFYMHKKDEFTLRDFISNGWRVMKPAFTMEDSGKGDLAQEGLGTPVVSDSKSNLQSQAFQSIDEDEKIAIIEEAALRQKEFANANKVLQDLQAEIWNVQKKLTMDYGPDGEFMILENQCFDYVEKRYQYRLCPFDKAVQVARHNKDETLLGLWNSWMKSDDGKHSQMNYTRGAGCWSGPSRSVLVNLHCDLENKLTSVIESSTCVYMFDFSTPASCRDVPSDIDNILNRNVLQLHEGF